MDGWKVEIRAYDDDRVEKVLGPYRTERAACRVDDGVNINLNHGEFYTVVVPPTTPQPGDNAMSDLIERLERWGRDEGLQNHFIGSRSARKDCAEAATALAEAEAEIARLRGESRALRAMIRVNLLRYGPSDLTHQEIDREIEIAVNPPPLACWP